MARDVVTARSFVLVDGQGRVRGTFDTARDGDPTLGLRDRGGRERVAVQVLKDGAPKMSLMDAGGRWTNYECK
jgi:hypothetical protein